MPSIVKLADAQWEWNPRGWPRGETPDGACLVYSRSQYCAARRAGKWPHPELSYWQTTQEPGRPADKRSLIVRLLLAFHAMVVRDGLDPQVVHRQFLKIDEYRRLIAPDCEGAER